RCCANPWKSFLMAGKDKTRGGAAREARLLHLATIAAVVLGYGGILLIYGPIVWLGLMSISQKPLTGHLSMPTLEWYARLFANPQWLGPLHTSLIVAILVAVLCMITATAVGRLLPRMGRG